MAEVELSRGQDQWLPTTPGKAPFFPGTYGGWSEEGPVFVLWLSLLVCHCPCWRAGDKTPDLWQTAACPTQVTQRPGGEQGLTQSRFLPVPPPLAASSPSSPQPPRPGLGIPAWGRKAAGAAIPQLRWFLLPSRFGR